ncbi:MAG: rhamnogalacturonan acetylesterase [Bacteroides sp.]|nr:rhamnogalacturonan acetylesterase [Bacteroides sp.]
MRKGFYLTTLMLAAVLTAQAQTFKFDFSTRKKTAEGFVKVTPQTVYSDQQGYGYDRETSWDGKGNEPFFFSVQVPDGNYHVTVTLGSDKSAGMTTVRGESRRLLLEHVATKKGEKKTESFCINKRDTLIRPGYFVKIKSRERSKLNWDNRLTLEFNGEAPRIRSLVIERVENVPTIFLCGNSTVVDGDSDPYTSWGQMIPRFFTDQVCVANYAESGLSADSFQYQRRLEKILTQIKPGDWLFVEFGHNDQKQKGAGKGAYYSFAYYIKIFIDKTREKGANPVIVTPTRRRQWSQDGKHILDTHGDYPKVLREIAVREQVPLIELQEMTKVLCETMGEEGSKNIFVHYPAGAFPGHSKEMKDNSHFNMFGAYEVAKCIAQGIKDAKLPLADYLRPDFEGFDPAQPDKLEDFQWDAYPYVDLTKPDGN